MIGQAKVSGLGRWWFGGLGLFLLATRFCHLKILWAEECYPAAAAIQLLHGKALYRDIWFDKPPLTPLVYLLWGAWPGWPLRLAGTVFALAVCWVAWRFAMSMWGEREGRAAACFMAFFLTFDIPSSVTTLAPDLLMVLPHLAAVYAAWRGRALAAGALAGVCFLINVKGALVALVCLLWVWRAAPFFLAGFLAPNLLMVSVLVAIGGWNDYRQQVWEWGVLYSRDTFVAHPLGEGIRRTANWLGFHAALAIGAAVWWWRERSAETRRMIAWVAVSLAGVAAGARFFPRYYFQMLPVMVLAGARGYALLGRRARVLLLLALVVPAVRFGPRYILLAADVVAGREHRWVDVQMNEDSRRITDRLKLLAKPGDSLLVWGYRPDVWVYTRMPAGTRYLDSQPLTGVIADRHLESGKASAAGIAAVNQRELIGTRPCFVVDGLGPYNPALAPGEIFFLRSWFARYSEKARTAGSVLYGY